MGHFSDRKLPLPLSLSLFFSLSLSLSHVFHVYPGFQGTHDILKTYINVNNPWKPGYTSNMLTNPYINHHILVDTQYIIHMLLVCSVQIHNISTLILCICTLQTSNIRIMYCEFTSI